MDNPNDSAIKFTPRRDNQGDYRDVNSKKASSNSSTPSKPFRDVMDQGSGGNRTLANRKNSLDEDEIAFAEGDTSTPSIFDIPTTQAKAKAALKDAPAPSPFAMQEAGSEVVEAPPPSPATLYQTLSKSDGKTSLPSHTSNETANLEGKILPTKNQNINPFEDKDEATISDQQAIEQQQAPLKDKSQEKFSSQFAAKEQPDLSYVNPLNQPTPTERMVDSTPQRAPLLPALTAQQIVEQIAHHMEVQDFKATGLTNTTVTLNYPPIFEKAQIVVTSFDTARNQFNITFQNLGPQAKNLLDQQATQDSLKHALEVKGYMVHIITATTTIAQPVITDASDQFRGYKEQPDEQQQGRRGKQQDEDET